MDVDLDKGRRFVSKFQDTHPGLYPFFYAVAGSHLYGYDDQTSDLDIRGFHIAPKNKFVKLDKPAESFHLDDGSERFKEFGGCDFTSYELRKFGSLLLKMNFNVIELLMSPVEFYNVSLERMDELEGIVENHLPGEAPKHYYGMALNVYHSHLKDRESSGYNPTAKNFLYALKGLLGAMYVQSRGVLNPDIVVLGHSLLIKKDRKILWSMVDSKRNTPRENVNNRLREKGIRLVEKLIDSCESLEFNSGDKSGLMKDIDSWMISIRKIYGRE